MMLKLLETVGGNFLLWREIHGIDNVRKGDKLDTYFKLILNMRLY